MAQYSMSLTFALGQSKLGVIRGAGCNCACSSMQYSILLMHALPGTNFHKFLLPCRTQVIAIEISAERLAMAQHNARLYGVDHKIEFICADFFDIAPTLAADGVFLSPPWGGPLYQ